MTEGPVFPRELPPWSRESLRKFCQAASPVDFKRGDTILHPLKATHSLYLVGSGVVNYRYFTKEGAAMTVLQLCPGDLFGLKAAFGYDGEKRYFYIMADTDTRLWQISRERFLGLMEADFEFTKAVAGYFTHYINMLERKIMRAAALDNYQNIVLLLLDRAEDIKNNAAVVQMTQQNLADLLMLSRQSVSGYLSSMVKRGLVAVRRGRIFILDWEALNGELL